MDSIGEYDILMSTAENMKRCGVSLGQVRVDRSSTTGQII